MTDAMNKTVDISFPAYLQLVAKKSAHEERNSKISIQSKYTVYTHEVVMQSRVLSSLEYVYQLSRPTILAGVY